MLADVRRTDGKARKEMFAAFAKGVGSNQREVVGRPEKLIAVINGKGDPFIHLDYIRDLNYGRLWKGECFELDGLKHAPFWGNPEKFVCLLEEFLKDVEKD